MDIVTGEKRTLGSWGVGLFSKGKLGNQEISERSDYGSLVFLKIYV